MVDHFHRQVVASPSATSLWSFHIAIEHGPFIVGLCIILLKLMIFRSYVSLPEGKLHRYGKHMKTQQNLIFLAEAVDLHGFSGIIDQCSPKAATASSKPSTA